MSEVQAAAGGLQALFSRPKKYYENVSSGTVQISSMPTDMVYIRECSNCEFRCTSKLVKCIIESCSNVKVAFEEPIMSGTLELIDSKSVSVFINPRDSLPTISAERCHDLHLHCVRPKALGSVYTVQCSDITVHFKPPYKEEYVLELPGEVSDANEQFVSALKGDKMVMERVIREGVGYATTATKKAEDDRREKELMRRFEEHLLKMFKIGPPTSSVASLDSQTSSKTESSPRENGEVEEKSGETGKVAEGASAKAEGKQEEGGKKEEEKEEGGNWGTWRGDGKKEGEEEEEEEEEGEETPLAAALREKRRGLKPTEV